MSAVQLVVRCRVKDGAADDVLALLPEYIEATRADPGNVAFEVYHQVHDDREFVALERYASREVLDEHRSSAHYLLIMGAKLAPLLDSYVAEFYEVTGDR